DDGKSIASGLDGVPRWLLRLGAPVFAKLLAALFNLSIRTSYVPVQWKTSSITPIPKINVPLKLSDYRLISITSVLSRVLERIIVQTYVYPAQLTSPTHLSVHDQY